MGEIRLERKKTVYLYREIHVRHLADYYPVWFQDPTDFAERPDSLRGIDVFDHAYEGDNVERAVSEGECPRNPADQLDNAIISAREHRTRFDPNEPNPEGAAEQSRKLPMLCSDI